MNNFPCVHSIELARHLDRLADEDLAAEAQEAWSDSELAQCPGWIQEFIENMLTHDDFAELYEKAAGEAYGAEMALRNEP